MLKRWKEKWQVSWINFILIICTFALGGSLCGILGRKILSFINLEKGIVYFTIYIITISIIWPCCVLFISIPLGQFIFFKNYLRRIFTRMSPVEKEHQQITEKKRIAIFASGAGSNALKIIEHLKNNTQIEVALIVSNKSEAGVISIANNNGIEVLIIEKEPFFRGDGYVNALKKHHINFVVLAGFLWKIPVTLIQAFPNKIINIHPALLPKYGGKGMYGHFVHEAVIANAEKESGITIHFVNEHFDEGEHIFQAKCLVLEDDTPDSLAKRIHELEHANFPTIVQKVVLAS